MKSDEKAAVMADFVAGKIQVLVADDGDRSRVDVPNAVADGDRARRALRARRSSTSCAGASAAAPPRARATCCSRSRSPTRRKPAQGRLREQRRDSRSRGRTSSIRGPGEFLGAKQSGVPLLRFADLEKDVALIEKARDAADELLRQGSGGAPRAHLERWLGGRAEFFKA
jgi:ATP-dependent DNA helicase RecG